ncbi:MAG: sialidase family protein, partial [Thermoanaerobaculia bacterium]
MSFETIRRTARRGKTFVLTLGVVGFATAEPSAGAEPTAPRIIVGPNILVSRDGDVPHVELMVATSPRTTKNLVGGAITATRPGGGMACRAYSSTDGGYSWKASEFPEQVEFGGGDPQVAYTAQGTALFVALTMNKSDKGKDCASMHVWRSEDGGNRWLAPAEIKCSPSWDHEQIVVDYTKGKYAGRIYLAVLYDYPVYRVGVFRSDDDGRTWTGPVEAANGGGTIGINDVTPMVLSDGTLLVPYGDFEFLPEKRKSKGKGTSNLWVVSSSDGGVTFSAPKKAVTQQYDLASLSLLAGFPKFATSGGSKSYPDRLYVAWEDARLGPYRILFSSSADRGKTWSEPKPLDARVPSSTHQFQPALAVNPDGVLAVTWYDTRDSSEASHFHQYFRASLDGGETFLPTIQISSAPSNLKGQGNMLVTPTVFVHEETISMGLLSAASRWASGGDYMG